MTPKIRVLISDDELLIRMAIRLLLQATEDLLCVGEVAQPHMIHELWTETELHILLTGGVMCPLFMKWLCRSSAILLQPN